MIFLHPQDLPEVSDSHLNCFISNQNHLLQVFHRKDKKMTQPTILCSSLLVSWYIVILPAVDSNEGWWKKVQFFFSICTEVYVKSGTKIMS